MFDELPHRTRVLLVAYALLSVLNVIAESGDGRVLTTVTKVLLMPLLLAALLSATPVRDRLVRFTALALAASWLGDLALTGSDDRLFLIGLGFFFIAQLCYIGGFWPRIGGSPLARRPVLALPYLGWWLLLMATLGPYLDSLLVPVTAYGLTLVTMAACATGVDRLTTVGATLFVLSDSLIAAGLPEHIDVPASGVLVMSTYTLGQALIMLGVLRATRTVSAGVGVRS